MIEAPLSRLWAISIVLIVLCGCSASKPANYYVLSSLQNSRPAVGTSGTEAELAIGVGPVKIAEYLDRPQIVTRTSSNGLQFAEFDRWAESLEKNLTRVVADNLSVLLSSERVCIFPCPKSMPLQYQVTLEIMHLEQMPDGKILLDASWNIFGEGGEKLLVMKRTRLNLPVQSAGFEGMASSESRAVEVLSGEIATTLMSLPRETSQ